MISKKMAEAVNKQINAELYSAYLYLGMSSYAATAGLKGTAHWLFVQAQEETTHALRFYNYLIEQNKQPSLSAVAQPPAKFKSSLDVFEQVLEHEKHVTALINEIANLAVKEGDHASSIMLQWFITEQIEEEANALDIISKLQMIGESKGGLYMLDKELAARMFVPAPDMKLP